MFNQAMLRFSSVAKDVRVHTALLSRSLATVQAGPSLHEAEPEKREEAKLKVRQRRLNYKSPARELLFGIHPVETALAEKRRNFYKIFLKKQRIGVNEELQRIDEWAQALKIPIRYEHRGFLDNLVRDATHQGVVLQTSAVKVQPWENAIQELGVTDDDGKVFVYVDRIQDPMNMGAVIRTCVFLGVDAILIPTTHSCKLSPIVSKASSGALECAPIYSVADPTSFFSFVKRLSWDVFGSDSDCITYDKVEVDRRNRVIVLGNEGHGVNEELVNFFTRTVSIPGLNKRIGSLNVTVSAGILLSHFTKHKRTENKW